MQSLTRHFEMSCPIGVENWHVLCRDEFIELLDKAKFERGIDTLILTGDLVDKGPYSIQARLPTNTLKHTYEGQA